MNRNKIKIWGQWRFSTQTLRQPNTAIIVRERPSSWLNFKKGHCSPLIYYKMQKPSSRVEDWLLKRPLTCLSTLISTLLPALVLNVGSECKLCNSQLSHRRYTIGLVIHCPFCFWQHRYFFKAKKQVLLIWSGTGFVSVTSALWRVGEPRGHRSREINRRDGGLKHSEFGLPHIASSLANSLALSCCVVEMQSGLQCVTLTAKGTDIHSCLSELGQWL